MPNKDRAINNQNQREWYQRNKDKKRAEVKIRRDLWKKDMQTFLQDYKTNNPCTDCKHYLHYSQMDFDHLRDKKYAIARMTTHSMETLLEEMSKCELVCSNCHRYRTWSRMQASVVERNTQ